MVNVQLDAEEAASLRRSLDWLLSDLRMEMCDTDRADFRDQLRKEKYTLERVISQLGEPAEQ